jgi:hypothetical protein
MPPDVWICPNQTDLNVMHDIKFGAYTLQLGVNVLNLFDSKTVTNIYDTYSGDSLKMRDAANKPIAQASHDEAVAFFKGFDPKALCAAQGCTLDPRYGKANAWQDGRGVRFNARVIF